MSRVLHVGEDVSVTEFYGGIERGRCVQIGTAQGFVQLDVAMAAAVLQALQMFLLPPPLPHL